MYDVEKLNQLSAIISLSCLCYTNFLETGETYLEAPLISADGRFEAFLGFYVQPKSNIAIRGVNVLIQLKSSRRITFKKFFIQLSDYSGKMVKEIYENLQSRNLRLPEDFEMEAEIVNDFKMSSWMEENERNSA